MNFNSMQTIRRLRPDIVHEFSERRSLFIEEMRRLVAEFRAIQKQYVFYSRSMRRDAYTLAGRQHLERRFAHATGSKREILAEFADLKRCIRLIDEVLFGSGEGTLNQDGRRPPAKAH